MTDRSPSDGWNVRRPIAVLVCLAAASLANGARGEEGPDWPGHLGPTRNGVYAGDDVASAWPEAGPAILWRKKVGGGFAGPAIAKGRLIVFHRIGAAERVECFDAVTGAPRWEHESPTAYRDQFGHDDGPRAVPAIAGDTVYTFGAEGVLHALALDDGSPRWVVKTQERFEVPRSFFGAACSPLVEGDVVVLEIGGKEGAGLVAFDRRTGATRWQATDHGASYSSPVAATIAERRCVVAFTRSGLAIVDAKSGALLAERPWRARIRASVNAATPLVLGDRIFISECYGPGAGLFRFDGKRLHEIWTRDRLLSNHFASSVHVDGYLYGIDGRQEYGPSLRCIRVDDASEAWTERAFGTGALIAVAKHVLFVSESGELSRFEATAKAFRRNQSARILTTTVRALPALARGRLYARDERELVCVDLRPPDARR